MPDLAPESDPKFDPLLPDQSPATKWFTPTPEQLVSPPAWLKGEKLAAWFRADLEKAIGAEWIDRGGTEQPYVKRPRPSTPTAKPRPEPKPLSPGAFAQGEFL